MTDLALRIRALRRAGKLEISLSVGLLVFRRTLSDGQFLDAMPLIFERSRLGYGHVVTCLATGDLQYERVWDFDSPLDALEQLVTWDGTQEPTGWTRRSPLCVETAS